MMVYGCKWLKWLEVSGNGLNCLNGLKWLEMAGNDRKWLEISGNGLSEIEVVKTIMMNMTMMMVYNQMGWPYTIFDCVL